MSQRVGSLVLTGALALWVLGVAGCGHAPTAPSVDSSQALTKSGAPGGGMGLPQYDPIGTPLSDPGAIDSADPAGPNQVQATTQVNGVVGKTLQLGHVRVTVPKHAFRGKGDVTLTLNDPAELNVHLAISPADKNGFFKPVTLEFDARACGEDCRVMQILWFDPALNQWVQIPSTIDTAKGTISAELMHFSKYKAVCETKRVGW